MARIRLSWRCGRSGQVVRLAGDDQRDVPAGPGDPASPPAPAAKMPGRVAHQRAGQLGQQRAGLAGPAGELLLAGGGQRDPDAGLAGGAGFGRRRPGQMDREILQLRVGQPRRDLRDPRQDRGHGRVVRRLQQIGERMRRTRRVAARRAGCGEPERRFGEVLRSQWRPGPDPGRPQRPGRSRRPGLDGARQQGARPDLGRPGVRALRWLASQDQVDGEPVRPGSADPRVPGAGRPRLGRGGQAQRGPSVAQHRVRGPDAGRRRQNAVGDREHGLDQGRGARRGPRVADVRADRAEHRDLPRTRPQGGESGQLGLVAGLDSRSRSLR